jgi:hypothetical protein
MFTAVLFFETTAVHNGTGRRCCRERVIKFLLYFFIRPAPGIF